MSARRRLYDGDGEGSFANALAIVRGLVEEHLRNMIDASARKYLNRYTVNEQAMGQANRVFIEIKDLLAQVRRNLERLVADDRKALEDSKGQETNALIAMEQLKPTLWGWGGKRALAESQKDYLGCVDAVVRWEQRERLSGFLRQLIVLADQRFTRWLEGMANSLWWG